MTTTTPVLSITIARLEGRDADLLTRNVASFAEADAVLARWSETAPKMGGYDKCAVVVTWASGDVYETRFDLAHPTSRPNARLAHHVRSELEFWSGAQCPAHMTADRYLACVEHVPADRRAGMVEMLRDCAL
jgi:hypothetical protein